MPSRVIREGIIHSSRMNSLSLGAEVFYRRLMSVADDYGRYHGSIPTLRASCWPHNPDKIREKEVSKWLTELLKGEEPLVRTYIIGGFTYVEIQNFGQQVRAKSKFPDPPWFANQQDKSKTAKQMHNECEADVQPSRIRSYKSESEAGAEEPPARKPPLAMPPRDTAPPVPDLHERFERLYAAHIVPGWKQDGKYEFCEIVTNSVNPLDVANSIERRHAEWMQFFRDNPTEYRPGFGKWLHDGYFTRAPVAAKGRDSPKRGQVPIAPKPTPEQEAEALRWMAENDPDPNARQQARERLESV